MAKKNSSPGKVASVKPKPAPKPAAPKPAAKPKQAQAQRNPLNTGGKIDPKSPPRRRNFQTELGAITAAGSAIANAQADAAIRVNDRFQDSAQESTREIAKELDNTYTAAARDNLTAAQSGLDQVDAASAGIGQLRQQYEAQGPDPVMSRLNDMAMEAAPNPLLAQLESQAATELSLGRSLSAEQERMAAQQARAGMSARGLGTGNSALAAEILNRDAFASAREADRRSFASAIANQSMADRQANRSFLGSVAGMNFDQNQGRTSMLSGLYGQQAGLGQTSAALNTGLAQSQVALDPYQRALGSNIPIATIAPSAGLVGQAYGSTMNYASDLFNTNTNMQASIYNSFQNNQSALRGAQIQGAATAGASQSSMMGSGMAAGGMVLGMTALAI